MPRGHACVTGTQWGLAQAKVDGQSHAIATLPALLARLDIQGRTLTFDTMPTQHETAWAVADAGGTSIWDLKGNPKTLYEDVKRYLEDSDQAASLQVSPSDVDTGHGRIETRTASVCHDMDRLPEHGCHDE